MSQITRLHPAFEVEEIRFENVSLTLDSDHDPILHHIDYSLPTDEILVIESSNPSNSALFLKMLAGQMQTSSGKILWNSEAVFLDESAIDPREIMACYFESYRPGRSETFSSVFGLEVNSEEYKDIEEYFDLSEYEKVPLKNLSYSLQKLAYLLASTVRPAQVLILEDPAAGLEESQWLNFLDYMQLKQRQGHLRHVFMTNHHPTALRHLSHNKIILEDGLLYFDEALRVKKASHF